MDTPRPCSCCGSRDIHELLDFGPQPICNRFLESATQAEALFPLAIGVCEQCGLIALSHNISALELQPRLDWIAYREAEAHLDDVAAHIKAIAGLPANDSRVLGISGHDTSSLERLTRLGYEPGHTLRLHDDLGIDHPGAGIETIQSVINPAWAKTRPPADIIIARYILEHAHDATALLVGMRSLIKPGGLISFEVPDFSVALAKFDYSTIWEEHTFYFTPVTLRAMLERHGFAVCELLSYPYPLENSLVALCHPSAGAPVPASRETRDREVAVAKTYASKFGSQRSRIQSTLARLADTGKIVVFGAGHLAAKYINLLGLAKYIAFVVDDHPKKRGLFMPGSRLPIKPSTALVEEGIKWCLLSLNPESEERVVKNLKPLFETGGIKTYSIFQASPNTLPLDP